METFGSYTHRLLAIESIYFISNKTFQIISDHAIIMLGMTDHRFDSRPPALPEFIPAAFFAISLAS